MTNDTPSFPSIDLRVRALGCDRGDRPVVREISLEAASGQAIQLFGDNGTGKTTILRALGGLTPIASGAIEWRVDGEECTNAQVSDHRVWLGMGDGLKSALSIAENLQYWCGVYGLDREAGRAAQADVLRRVGLEQVSHQRFSTLSAGQKRRVQLARCLLARRPIWLLDEPASALDGSGRALVASLISEHLGAGGLVILATHHKLEIASQNLVLDANDEAQPQ